MIKRLQALKNRYEALGREMSQPELAQDPQRFQELARQHAELREVVDLFGRYTLAGEHLDQARAMLESEKDPDLRAMAQEEVDARAGEREALEADLRVALLPRDPNDGRNAYIEVRAGAGGDEAGLFGAELLRMYSRWAEDKGFKIESVSVNATEAGGIKEAVLLVKGTDAYKHLKYEGGVHRVQRVPVTESGGRIHTSTVTVAAMPEVEAREFEVDEDDFRWDVFRASGAGGQHVNRTESAVRLTHLPSGTVVSMQDERSQIKNRAKAMKIMLARLKTADDQRKAAANAAERKGQVGTGDRSEKIRTYNYPQSRVTDHRLGWSSHNLDGVMQGDLDPFLDRLMEAEQALKLAELTEA